MLPAEILAKIFEQGRDLNTLGSQHFEVLASHVTSFWREVAISTPSLWNILEIAPSQSSQMIAAYIARAKASRAVVSQPSAADRTTGLQYGSLTKMFVDHWRSLEISTGPDDAPIYTTLAHLEPFRASLLEAIVIKSSSLGQRSGVRHSSRCFHAGAPRLQKLCLQGTYLTYNWPPVTHITTLYLHNLSARPDWNRFRELLVSSLQLRHLSLCGRVVSGRRPPEFEIVLPNLRSLRIRGTGLLGSRASDLLLAISAPHLSSLTLFNVVYKDLDLWLSGSVAGLEPLQSLTSLTLYWPKFRAITYITLSQTMPCITRLSLMDRQPEVFLQFLSNSILGSSVLPWTQLADLALYPANPSQEHIEHLVRSRADNHAPLRVLRLGNGAPIPGVKVVSFDSPPRWPEWPKYNV
ncbi:hypothetical protein DFH06DRAFT_968962 [Mycena polygramma]|nr:hypothetical protein DFH06DRAFT_968962 [Mycena polygramma]